ncbi:MAG: DJ-1/PfpI family protein [Candidatus Saganbacteria bacterium]|nr:DJ-1/PfpI family protein [Candidatus Saganbacteria bacterium]
MIFSLLCMAFLFSFAACSEAGSLTWKKILLIIAHKDFQEKEYTVPRKIFETEGATVEVASSSKDLAKGTFGMAVKPDMALQDVNVSKYNAIVFIGGAGAEEYYTNKYAHTIAQKAYRSNKVVGAICIAPVTLANAGVLRGKKATVWSSEAENIKRGGAIYTGKAVEQDGKIITANGPHVAGTFANLIVIELKK